MKSPLLKRVYLALLGSLILLFSQCTPSLSKALQKGYIEKSNFREVVEVEVRNGLIIIPIQINGQEYRFLFDSGAPLSISQEIQDAFVFKKVAKGNIRDSDQNRSAVDYVRVDSLLVGDVMFKNQTAFVADFKANPVLACFELDGILGSNLMRHCNWVIDYQSGGVILSSDILPKDTLNALKLRFTPDNQYDININLNIGRETLSNVKVDYGSNGSLMVPSAFFEKLKEEKIIKHTYFKRGRKQSGLIGQPVSLNQELANSDSINIGGFVLENIQIRSGTKGLLGQDILERFSTCIDWNKKVLYLTPKSGEFDEHMSFGLGLWPSEEGRSLRVQWIIEKSAADEVGLKVGMDVIRLDELDFQSGSTFCEYVDWMNDAPEILQIFVLDESGEIRNFKVEKASL